MTLRKLLTSLPLPLRFRLGSESLPAIVVSVPNVVQRAITLLRGGVTAARVWRVMSDDLTAPTELTTLAAQIAESPDAAAAIAEVGGPEWRVLSAAWRLAEMSGAPLVTVLERFGAAILALERLAERRSVLLASPRATIKLVASLPPLALLLGAVLGFDPVAVLLSPLGLLLAVVGVTLLAIGAWWAMKLIRRLADADWVAGLEFELCWVALSGGAAHTEAMRRVADCVIEAHAGWVRLSALRRDGAVWQSLSSASSLGTPVMPVLLAEADAARSRAMNKLEREAEKLGIRVLIPIALCVLPSFIVLGVLPVLFAVMGSLIAS